MPDEYLNAIDPQSQEPFKLMLRDVGNGQYAPVTSPHIGGAPVVLAPSVGTTAAALVSQATPAVGVTIKNPAANAGTVYLGLNGVTAATGFPLAPGESVQFPVVDLSKLVAIASAGTVVIRVIGVALA